MAVSPARCSRAVSATAASTCHRRWSGGGRPPRRHFGELIDVDVGDLNGYEPSAPVACTTCFRAVYYAADRPAFFRHVAGFTEKKLVFDLNPRQYDVTDVVAELEAAGLGDVTLRPFFAPQRIGLPRPIASCLRMLERSGPLARALLRVRFSYLVAASPC